MNTSKRFSKILASLALATLVAVGIMPMTANAQYRSRRANERVYAAQTVKANTVIRVRMEDEITSEKSYIGERFQTEVTDPVYSTNGALVIPAGSTVQGRITDVRKAQGKGKPGTISVAFDKLTLENGRSYAINGSLIANDELDDVDDEGQLKGRSQTKRNVILVGGGTAIGAAVGALAGGGKGALIGALIGGGLGAGGAWFGKGDSAEVKEGTQLGVILNRNLTLNAY